MRLLSATVRNYRIHREITVELDPSRTLIGGPNESGKSTLIEAIHRGLFLKSKVTGEGRASMVSTRFPGNPEVEIRFSTRDQEYRLTKHFAGANGTTLLIQSGGQTWQGEEAETRLAELLMVAITGGGRGILGRLSQTWSHLWVWQGRSGDDPSEHVAAQQDFLLQQLQQIGGAVSAQSELDGRVALRFSEERSQLYVRTGNARAGSDLDLAQREAEQSHSDLEIASERLERLKQASRDFEKSASIFRRTSSDLADLQQELVDVNQKLSRAEELNREKTSRLVAVQDAVESLANLKSTETTINELRDSITQLKRSLEPRQEKEEIVESTVSDGRRRTANAMQEYDSALKKASELRLRKELASACVARFEKQARVIELNSRWDRVQSLRTEIIGFREQLATLPWIDAAGLEKLQILDNELGQAGAALNAMAAEVEVVESDQPVHIDNAEMSVGEKRTVTSPTVVKIGKAICLRIYPGGGERLANALDHSRSLKEELRQALDQYGLDSIDAASTILARRSDLDSRTSTTEAALEALDAEIIDESLRVAKGELTAIEAEINRRRDQLVDAQTPLTRSDAKAWQDREVNDLNAAETEVKTSKSVRDALQQEQLDHDDELNKLRGAIADEKRKLTVAEAQLSMLLDSHGDNSTRERARESADMAVEKAQVALAEIESGIKSLQPDLLEADRQRLQRAIDETMRQNQDAQTDLAVSQAALRSDGRIDPRAALAQAQARQDAACEHLEAVSRKAKAAALVDNLFQQEQQALADRYSQPLAVKISSYLQCLFGPDAKAVVAFEDNAFRGVKLLRSAQDHAVEFSSLSGGSREQVAAAVRLAIAEVLAANYDNSLPIVFDDAFAYSDPNRVNTLQRMLDLGASRGLQIIVLTCNPSDYAALGAHAVILKSGSDFASRTEDIRSTNNGKIADIN